MFTYHTKDTAPAESAPLIDQTVKTFGSLVNLHALLAEAPTTYETYHMALDGFLNSTTLTPLEAQVVWMTSNYLNGCHYCMAGHTAMMKAAKMPDDVIEALREGAVIADAKLEALRTFCPRVAGETRPYWGRSPAGFSRCRLHPSSGA